MSDASARFVFLRRPVWGAQAADRVERTSFYVGKLEDDGSVTVIAHAGDGHAGAARAVSWMNDPAALRDAVRRAGEVEAWAAANPDLVDAVAYVASRPEFGQWKWPAPQPPAEAVAMTAQQRRAAAAAKRRPPTWALAGGPP